MKTTFRRFQSFSNLSMGLIVCYLLGPVYEDPARAVPTAMFTQNNNNARTCANLAETLLSTNNVNTNQFGLLYTRPVDDQIYAQPLIATNVSIPGKGARNLVIVATVNDSVYAFDADDSSVTAPYWSVSFINPPNVVAPANTDLSAIGACGGSRAR